MEVVMWILGLVLFVVVLLISVGLHEAGHMTAARWFKLKVPQFFVGFGKTLWSFTRKGTEYGIKAIPLGGFVSIEDPKTPRDTKEGEYASLMLSHVHPLKRIVVFIAGPAVNILLGGLILIVTFMSFPMYMPSTTIGTIAPCMDEAGNFLDPSESSCTGAAAAGLLPGDKFVAIDGTPVETKEQLDASREGKKSLVATIERDGERIDIPVTLNSDGLLGLNVTTQSVHLGFFDSAKRLGTVFADSVSGVLRIPERIPPMVEAIVEQEQRSPDSPAGMVAAGKSYGDIAANTEIPAADKWQMLLLYSGILNVGLGLINLVPIMPLDGGRVVVALADWVKMWWAKARKKEFVPVGQKLATAFTMVGLLLVVGLMGVVMASDISQISLGFL